MTIAIEFDLSAFALSADEFTSILENAAHVDSDEYLDADFNTDPSPKVWRLTYTGFPGEKSEIKSALFRIRAFADNAVRLSNILHEIIANRDSSNVGEQEAIKALLNNANNAARITGLYMWPNGGR